MHGTQIHIGIDIKLI